MEHIQSFGRAIDVAIGGGGSFGAGLVWGGISLLLMVSCCVPPLFSTMLTL